ncbi:inversin isoform 2-T2 [Synchiropus picturatus]
MAAATDSQSWASLGSQVHAAAVNGDRSALQKLITEPALRDREDQFGRTPLMYCVLADRLDCADVLLKAGASVNKTDHSRRTALHLAAQKGNIRFLKLLLSRRANWLQKDIEEITPLHLATRHTSSKALALLLKYIGPGEVDTQDKNKQTALHWSAFYNRPEHVRLLIKHDSNIGIPDSEGKIPLHWAAHSQEPSATQTVRCILEAAPTESLLNWQDYEGRTPLHFAVADGNEAVVEVLTSYEGCNVTAYDNLFRTPLHWAALLGKLAVRFFFRKDQQVISTGMLLAAGVCSPVTRSCQNCPPTPGKKHIWNDSLGQPGSNTSALWCAEQQCIKDEPDLEGRTAFMWAAGKGSDDVIKTMLTLTPNIDINMADKYGGTALHAASLSGHVSTMKLLLDRGAMVDTEDVMKHTPLFRACEMGHRDVILTLIKGSARVDLVDVDGHTALHWAALGGNAEVCQMLMENGISPNVQDQAGRTPLQCAAYGGYITCMAVLMENNADPNIQDKEGRTALHWSSNNGYLDAVKLLLGYNTFPNHMEYTEERYTPLDYALLGGHSEVTQFMLEHGALSIAAIQDIAAATIQAVYKGYTVRKAFRERKQLLMRHEQLRKDAAKKREEEQRRKDVHQQVPEEKERVVSIMQDLSMKESVGETSKSSKAEQADGHHKGHKSRRKKVVELTTVLSHDRTPDCASGTVHNNKFTELLSRPTVSQLPHFKPRPPSTPKMREQTTSKTSPPRTSCRSLADSKTSHHKRDTHSKKFKTDSHKQRKPNEKASEKLTHGTPLLKCCSLNGSGSASRTEEATQVPTSAHTLRACEKDQLRRRNKAAQIIQRAWRRFCTNRQRKVKTSEELESSDFNQIKNRKRTERQVSPGKLAVKKSLVLQSIYGNPVARQGRPLRVPQAQVLLDLPLRTQSRLSGIDGVHLTEAINQAKHFSYHLRPLSAGQGTRGRGKY